MVPTHQIHNVLKAFTRNLALGGACRSSDAAPGAGDGESPASGKRKVLTEQITAAIRSKIIRMSRAGRPGLQVVSLEGPEPDPSGERAFSGNPGSDPDANVRR